MGTVAEEWMKRGEARGRAEGKAAMLAHMLERRFGELPAWAHERLHQADDARLDAWADALLDAQALEEVLTAEPSSSRHTD
jgi:hypothetical protein